MFKLVSCKPGASRVRELALRPLRPMKPNVSVVIGKHFIFLVFNKPEV